MRRASFYIGLIVLGTVGPLAVASFVLEVVSIHRTRRRHGAPARRRTRRLLRAALDRSPASGCSWPRSRARRWQRRSSAGACRGGRSRHARPWPGRAWSSGASSSDRSSSPSRSAIAQAIVDAMFMRDPRSADRRVVRHARSSSRPSSARRSHTSWRASCSATWPHSRRRRRSFRVFRVRKTAAALVAVFQTIAVLLVLLGLSAGLDIALRVFDALGLGTDSGPAGLILVVVGIVVGVFAFGTLVYTALAISLAPQMLMFVGLTRATFGLDHVRPGGANDPADATSWAAPLPMADPPDGRGLRDRDPRPARYRGKRWLLTASRVSRSPARSAGRRRCRGGGPVRG